MLCPQLAVQHIMCFAQNAAICGHKSFEKQDSRSVDIFDTKPDLNPFSNKIYAVEFMQLAQCACKLSLGYEVSIFQELKKIIIVLDNLPNIMYNIKGQNIGRVNYVPNKYLA